MKNQTASRSSILGVALVFVLSACSSGSSSSSVPTTSAAPVSSPSATAPPPATVKVGVGNPIFSFSPIYVAKAKGFWKDENLDVQLTFFSSGTDDQQAILSGAVDVAAGAYTEPMTLSGLGEPSVIIASIQAALPYKLMTKTTITNVSQLTGKTLGVSKIGSLSDEITRIALDKKGIDPASVKIQQAGSSPSRLAALQAGALDGTILSSPDDQVAIKAGLHMLIDISELMPDFAYEVLYAKKSTIVAQGDVLVRFMKGYIKAAKYFTDPAHEAEVLKIVSEAIDQKVADLKLGYDDTIKDFPPTGAPIRSGIEQALKGSQQFGSIPGIGKLTADDLYYPDLQQKAAAALGLK